MQMFSGVSDMLIGWLLAAATLAARFISNFNRSKGQSQSSEIESTINELLKTSSDQDIKSLRPLGEMPFARSVWIDFLGDQENTAAFSVSFEPPEGTRAVLKRSSSPGGMESLVRQHERLAMAHAELPTGECDFSIPQILAFSRASGVVWSIEKFIGGKDGRSVIQAPDLRAAALVATANAIDCLQSCTVKATVIDTAWIEEWIDRPAAVLCEPVHTLMSRRARQAAVATFKLQQRTYWFGRTVPLGWYHGDFNPGNILFRQDRWRPETNGQVAGNRPSLAAVEGIIDWDRAGRNGPQGFDICHLAISARRVLTGRQVGEIIRDLLLEGRWNADELAWFGRCKALDGPAGEWTSEPAALRAMVGLVWLRLMIANIEKSSDYLSNRLWSAANVERVLKLSLRNITA